MSSIFHAVGSFMIQCQNHRFCPARPSSTHCFGGSLAASHRLMSEAVATPCPRCTGGISLSVSAERGAAGLRSGFLEPYQIPMSSAAPGARRRSGHVPAFPAITPGCGPVQQPGLSSVRCTPTFTPGGRWSDGGATRASVNGWIRSSGRIRRAAAGAASVRRLSQRRPGA